MIRRTVGVVAVAVLVLAACGIDADTAPRDIAPDQRGQLEPVDPSGGASSGASRVFLLTDASREGERLLRSVLRDVPATPANVLQALIEGPNASEVEDGLLTALPPDVRLLSARAVAGTLNIDLSPEILELQSSALAFAVAQIVFTADELDGVRAVRLRVDGSQRAWPAGRGELQTTPLTVYDFPGYAETTQPHYPAIPTSPAA